MEIRTIVQGALEATKPISQQEPAGGFVDMNQSKGQRIEVWMNAEAKEVPDYIQATLQVNGRYHISREQRAQLEHDGWTYVREG